MVHDGAQVDLVLSVVVVDDLRPCETLIAVLGCLDPESQLVRGVHAKHWLIVDCLLILSAQVMQHALIDQVLILEDELEGVVCVIARQHVRLEHQLRYLSQGLPGEPIDGLVGLLVPNGKSLKVWHQLLSVELVLSHASICVVHVVVDAGLGGHPRGSLKVAVRCEFIRSLHVHNILLVIERLLGVDGGRAGVEVSQITRDLAPPCNFRLL